MAYSSKVYTRMLRRMAKLKKARKKTQWRKLQTKASVYRRRLIAANRSTTLRGTRRLAKFVAPKNRKLFRRITRTKAGKMTLRRFRKFWKLPFPPSINLVRSGGKHDRKKLIPLLQAGTEPVVHISDHPKGGRGKRIVVHGKWAVGVTPDGRQIILLSKRTIKGPWKQVGYTPETHYVPPKDIEDLGVEKSGFYWKHKHSESGGKWPRLYADRNGKVDGNSNFATARSTLLVSTWMHR